MKNLLIRRPMIEQAGTQSQEIHIQFPSIEVRHCTAFGGSVQETSLDGSFSKVIKQAKQTHKRIKQGHSNLPTVILNAGYNSNF